MPVEVAKLVDDFNKLWPRGTDPVSKADNHIRMIKEVLQLEFELLYNKTRVFSFEKGAVVTPGSILYYEAEKAFYQWNGAYGVNNKYVVNAGSTPTTAGGIGGNAWTRSTGSGFMSTVLVSDTEPTNPFQNMLWWDTNSGIFFIYYNDGTSTQWVDLFGIADQSSFNTLLFRSVLTRLAAESGYTLVGGSFQEGAVSSGSSDVVLDWNTAKFYQWHLNENKEVPAGSTPATTGGIGAGAWVDRTDVTLRGDLSGASGAELIGFSGLKSTTAAAILNIEKRDAYVTDYSGYDTDIGMVLNNLIGGIPEGGGLRIIIPKGKYTLLTPVVKTLLENQKLEILFQHATINCKTDNHGIKITGNDSNYLHIGGTGRINAAFGCNSASSIGLGVYGFRFPKSLLIDGAITIGTLMHDMNWRYGFEAGNNDTATFFNLHIQSAQTAPYTQTAIRVFSDTNQTTDNRFIACTTGAHKYAVEAYNKRTGEGLEGLQFIDCTLIGSILVQNLIDPEIYAPPQFWFKGCHVNNFVASNPVPFHFASVNSIRITDCNVYTYTSGLAAIDSCTGIDITDVDVNYFGGGGNTIYLIGNNNPCGDLSINGLRDHTSDPLGHVVVMADSNIYGIRINSAYKAATDKPWIRNNTDTNWSKVSVSKDLVFGPADERLLRVILPGVVGSLDISASVGSVVKLSTTANISQILGRFPTTLTIVADVPGTQFTHTPYLLLFGNTSVLTKTAGAQLTFVYQGGGVYREISRSNPI
jgi:hypothetical protein